MCLQKNLQKGRFSPFYYYLCRRIDLIDNAKLLLLEIKCPNFTHSDHFSRRPQKS